MGKKKVLYVQFNSGEVAELERWGLNRVARDIADFTFQYYDRVNYREIDRSA